MIFPYLGLLRKSMLYNLGAIYFASIGIHSIHSHSLDGIVLPPTSIIFIIRQNSNLTLRLSTRIVTWRTSSSQHHCRTTKVIKRACRITSFQLISLVGRWSAWPESLPSIGIFPFIILTLLCHIALAFCIPVTFCTRISYFTCDKVIKIYSTFESILPANALSPSI